MMMYNMNMTPNGLFLSKYKYKKVNTKICLAKHFHLIVVASKSGLTFVLHLQCELNWIFFKTQK